AWAKGSLSAANVLPMSGQASSPGRCASEARRGFMAAVDTTERLAIDMGILPRLGLAVPCWRLLFASGVEPTHEAIHLVLAGSGDDRATTVKLPRGSPATAS